MKNLQYYDMLVVTWNFQIKSPEQIRKLREACKVRPLCMFRILFINPIIHSLSEVLSCVLSSCVLLHWFQSSI